jgi:hypothetical protein
MSAFRSLTDCPELSETGSLLSNYKAFSIFPKATLEHTMLRYRSIVRVWRVRKAWGGKGRETEESGKGEPLSMFGLRERWHGPLSSWTDLDCNSSDTARIAAVSSETSRLRGRGGLSASAM